MRETDSGMGQAVIEHNCVLYAHRTEDTLMVYRSPVVREDDDVYQPVLEHIGDAELVHRETVVDDGMAFGESEVSLYRVAAEVAA